MQAARVMMYFAFTMIAAMLVSGCASKPSKPEVINVNGLIPITDTRTTGARAYKAPNFDRSKYTGKY